MADDVTTRADQALEAALAETGARDPREFYRERLKELKQSNPNGYASAVQYYKETLLPSIADQGRPALDAWTEYGRVLAESVSPGRTVSIDATGRAHPYEGPNLERLILHLPDGKGRALLVGLPPELSSEQRATYDVLVAGKLKAK
ncbi:MAG: hypothetical protein AAF389_00755 [Gemmatimonadota bacterium]